MKQQKLRFDSLTSATWKQFETLMGEKGGFGNCWCMYFRLPYKDFQENKPDGNKKLIKQLVNKGLPQGLIASLNNEPVGWIALAPREDYVRLENSRAFKRIDDKPVWSITCFFIKKGYRHMGLSQQLKVLSILRKRRRLKLWKLILRYLMLKTFRIRFYG